MKKSFKITSTLKFYIFILVALPNLISGQQSEKPKLVVGIVIDQMRAEYLYRFKDNYTDHGFKRLISDGFNVKNMHYNYVPTVTAPGHASIYTGTTPSDHGIVSNKWFDRKLEKSVYCVSDDSTKLIGSKKQTKKSASSPVNLLSTTITDELKLFSNKRAKVIGISLKDRGAILPAGHFSDYAFWYNTADGNFVTSSYYSDKLPKWLETFNRKKKSDSLLNQVWETLLPIERYVNSTEDDALFEKKYKGKEKSTFPYDLNALKKENGNYNLVMETPFGNSLLTDLAIATIDGEELGQKEETDFLTISFSSTDKVGHNFGVRSKELEDTYTRLDRELARLINHLDKKIGKGEYLLFLTADHAANDNVNFLKSNKLPVNSYNPVTIEKVLNEELSKVFGVQDYIYFIDDTQIYFNYHALSKNDIIRQARKCLENIEGIKTTIAPAIDNHSLYNSDYGEFVKNGYYSKRSGDIYMQFNSGWITDWGFGTTHFTSYNQDTHVPLLLFGWNIEKGSSIKYHTITQIAPTISFLLNIPFSTSSDKAVIEEVFNN